MFMRMVYEEKLAQAAYVIGCQRTGEAIVIDPLRDVDRYEKIAAKEGLRLVAAAETHIHADFLSGARELAEKGAMVYVSGEGGPDWTYQWVGGRTAKGTPYAHRVLKDGDTFKIGNILFTVVHTPGHTPEHICFMVTDLGGGATEPMGIATGDFVFVGDLGRPDLLETAAGIAGQADPSAHRLYDSVRRFALLPDYMQVWPAHGAGSACGKALGAVPQSTVGYEKRFSPAINAALGEGASEGTFVTFILEGQPEPPLYFARMKHDNKAGPVVLGGLPEVRELGVDALLELNARRAALIDTRPWEVFRKGHVPGALYLPVNSSFTTDAGSIVRDDEPIYLIVDPARLEEAVRDLIRIGLDRIEGWFSPTTVTAYAVQGGGLDTIAEVSVADATEKLSRGEVTVLDVRRRSEYDQGHIPGALQIAHTRLGAHLDRVPRDKPVLVHCRSGGRSSRAAALLAKHGYRAMNLAGGMLAWEQAPGAPCERA
ncbi:MAG: MBL fold metallo-hydrolase [Phycisphaeraceae bacterium]|nr:MBL fold metallo-hydrolase [Phycisphaeraceae bacterium]